MLSKNVTVPEKVVERKIIVYKPRIDIKAVRATAEKMKTQLFRKLVFMKPKPEEVQLVSINRYFEPYVVVDGEYSIERVACVGCCVMAPVTVMDEKVIGHMAPTKVDGILLKHKISREQAWRQSAGEKAGDKDSLSDGHEGKE